MIIILFSFIHLFIRPFNANNEQSIFQQDLFLKTLFQLIHDINHNCTCLIYIIIQEAYAELKQGKLENVTRIHPILYNLSACDNNKRNKYTLECSLTNLN